MKSKSNKDYAIDEKGFFFTSKYPIDSKSAPPSRRKSLFFLLKIEKLNIVKTTIDKKYTQAKFKQMNPKNEDFLS